MAKLQKIPGIADLESSEKGANPTLAVRINNELASDLGLTTAAIGNALRPLIAGEDYPAYRHGLPVYATLKNVAVARRLAAFEIQ